MKQSTYIFIIVLSLATSNVVQGQEVFGQDNVPNSLTPGVEISYDDLPEKVRSVVEKSEFGKLELKNVYEVGKRTAQRKVHYNVRFKNGDEFYDVYLDDEGNIIDPQDSDNDSNSPSPK